MKKIFLTGATGFIGKKLVEKINGKYKIACLVRKTSNVELLKEKNIELVIGDLLEKESFIDGLNNADVVIHLAISHNKGNEKLNFEGSKNIIEACKEKKVKKLIYISSMAVKREIMDDYGKTKLKVEEVIKKSGLNYTILRPSMIYDEKNLGLIGKSLGIPLIIPIIGNGKYKINPIYADDVVDSIIKSIENKKSNKNEYDIAGQESLSFNEIVEVCKKQFKIRKVVVHVPLSLCILMFKFIPIVSVEAIKGINQDTSANIDNLKKDLNIKPINFIEGIKNVNL